MKSFMRFPFKTKVALKLI